PPRAAPQVLRACPPRRPGPVVLSRSPRHAGAPRARRADTGPDALGAAGRHRERRALGHRRRGPTRLALGPAPHARRPPGRPRPRLLAEPQLHLPFRVAARLAPRRRVRLYLP